MMTLKTYGWAPIQEQPDSTFAADEGGASTQGSHTNQHQQDGKVYVLQEHANS